MAMRACTTWSPAEDDRLRALRAAGLTWEEVAVEMGRTKPSVVGRAAGLGIRAPKPPDWSPRDLSDLDTMLDLGWPDVTIARRLGRSVAAIHNVRKRRRVASRTARLLSSRAVADQLGVRCSKTVARWIERGWLKGKRGPSRGAYRQWQVAEEELWAFVEDAEHWHRWNPERIPDAMLREWAIDVRGGARFLTPGQVAWRLCVTVGAVNDWIHQGILPAVRSGNWLVREEDVESFVPPGQRSKIGMSQRTWFAEDDARLIAMRDAGCVWREIGLALGRPLGACAARTATRGWLNERSGQHD